MRSFLPRGTLLVGAVLLGTVLFSGTAQARRPVVAPGQQAPVKPPPPPPVAPAPAPEAEKAEKPADAAAPVAGEAAAPAAPAKPKEPPKPVDFIDAGKLATPAAAPAEAAPVGPHKELRHTREAGDYLYVLSVRPGEPKAGDPVELFFRINEMLPIPDPAYGDRKPLQKGKLRVRVAGGGMDRTFEIHELGDAGTYGAHFTAAGTGVYKLEVERLDGRRAQKVEFAVGIGVPTPGLANAEEMEKKRRTRNGTIEGVQLVGVAGPSDATIAGVMDELGRRWMELERHAGTPAAAAAAAEVKAQAAKIAGKMPQVAGGFAGEFDQLATALVERLGRLEGQAADRTAVLGSMQQVQDELCMRCHAKYRHQFADDVATWPDFGVKQNLQPPPATNTTGARTRTPFRAK